MCQAFLHLGRLTPQVCSWTLSRGPSSQAENNCPLTSESGRRHICWLTFMSNGEVVLPEGGPLAQFATVQSPQFLPGTPRRGRSRESPSRRRDPLNGGREPMVLEANPPVPRRSLGRNSGSIIVGALTGNRSAEGVEGLVAVAVEAGGTAAIGPVDGRSDVATFFRRVRRRPRATRPRA